MCLRVYRGGASPVKGANAGLKSGGARGRAGGGNRDAINAGARLAGRARRTGPRPAFELLGTGAAGTGRRGRVLGGTSFPRRRVGSSRRRSSAAGAGRHLRRPAHVARPRHRVDRHRARRPPAAGGAVLGSKVRGFLDRKTGLPDPVFGALEDVVAIALGVWAVM